MPNDVDRLEYAQFGLTTPTTDTICTRLEENKPTAYCGKDAATDYHPDNHREKSGRSRYMQHCLPCDREYRKKNAGRCATTV